METATLQAHSPAIAASTTVKRLQPSKGWKAIDVRELWEFRELLWILAVRDVTVRYKQTILGVGWVILQPLVNTGIFSFIFGTLAKVTPSEIPPTVFIFASMMPYGLFNRALSSSAGSLVGNAHIIKKVYFPRLIYPLAPILGSVLDFTVGLGVLSVLMILLGVTPSPWVVMLPLFVALAIFTGLAFGLFFAAMNVVYRDIGFMVGFILSIWMYVTPVFYPLRLVAEKWPRAYPFFLLNPMTGVVEGYRWAIFGPARGADFPLSALSVGVPIMLVVLVLGLFFFRRMEKTFADVV